MKTYEFLQTIILLMKKYSFTLLSVIVLAFSGCSMDIKPISTSKSPDIDNEKTVKPKEVVALPAKEEVIQIPKPPVNNTVKVEKYCEKIDQYFAKYKWGSSQCEKYQWNHVRSSFWGNPIIWHVFGSEEDHQVAPKNTTLILCGVHGDEITPIKFCFDILEDLANNPQIYGSDLVVVAPIVTPDSFMRKIPSRTNARGVDVNRNFPTTDWDKSAISLWKSRYRSDRRRFPGNKALSEQETIFQVNLIKRYNPNKILSVHSPLTLIDYDGPAHEDHGGKQLLVQMSDRAGKYKINNYPFFTGSLGNYAGNERNIPTYTIELPNSDWTKTKKYYNKLRPAIHHAISHSLSADQEITKSKKSNE